VSEYETRVIVDLSTFSSPRFADRLGANRARIFFGEKVSVGELTLGKTLVTLHHIKGISFDPITLRRTDVARINISRSRVLRRWRIQMVVDDGSAITVRARTMRAETLTAFETLARESQGTYPVPPRPAPKLPNRAERRMSGFEAIWLAAHIGAFAVALGITSWGAGGPIALALCLVLLIGFAWPVYRMWAKS
jgi:hypothetical protein